MKNIDIVKITLRIEQKKFDDLSYNELECIFVNFRHLLCSDDLILIINQMLVIEKEIISIRKNDCVQKIKIIKLYNVLRVMACLSIVIAILFFALCITCFLIR